MLRSFLSLKSWVPYHSSVWREILARWGQDDYDDLEKRQEHEDTLKSEWDAHVYSRDRDDEYPSIEDQLDYIYHNGIAKWKSDMVKPVKDAHPKP